MNQWTDGHIIEDCYIWKGLDKSGHATKGFIIEPQDLRHSKIEYINRFGRQLSKLLLSFSEPARVQLKWGVNADYSDMLGHYEETTSKKCIKKDGKWVTSEWCGANRNEIADRYRTRMDEGDLRREKLMIFVTIPIKTSYTKAEISKSKKRKIILKNLLKQVNSLFKIEADKLTYILGPGVNVRAMHNKELKVSAFKHFNRSSLTYSENQIDEDYDESISILDNCVNSEYIGVDRTYEDNYSLFGDHYFQDFLVLTKFPETYDSAFTHILTSLDTLNYEITVNITPQNVRAKINKEERIVKAMRNQQKETEEVGIDHDILAKSDKILRLKSGNIKPFKFEYFIQGWDTSKEELSSKMQNIAAACMHMGAEYYQPEMGIQAINMLAQTQIGYPLGVYNKFGVEGDSDHARLLPISSTFVGWTDPDAIFDGDNMNLIGIKQYLTTSQPQHCVVYGAVGSGKSALMINLLTQTHSLYDYSVIIEEGASYPGFAMLEGERPIILSPNNDLTINYFDTNGLPLTAEHKGDAIAILSMMCGQTLDPEYEKLRGAMMLHYLDECYKDAYEIWAKSNRDKIQDIIRYILVVPKYKKNCPPDYNHRDVFLELKEVLLDESHEFHNEAKELWNDISVREIVRFKSDLANYLQIMSYATAWFEEDDFPRHRDLVDKMYSHKFYKHSQETIDKLATLLAAFCEGGAYGCVFDGVSNVNLKAKLVYFDLAPIGQSAKDLKAIIAFLITNHVRNYIMTMPRNLRKRMIFEEMARFKDIPGADKLIEEAYSQMRKYGLWVCSLLQNHAQIKDHSFADIVTGNASQYLICQQKKHKDVHELGNEDTGIDLPEETMDAITNFVNPSALPSNDRYASFIYYHNAQFPMIGVSRNYCSPEMLYVSSISGESYEKSMREMSSMESPMDAVAHFANLN